MPNQPSIAPRRMPRQARSTETLERILDAAARVFSDHGYAAGTTNRIAAEASMSIGSLYQYFPNKDAILVALARRHMCDTTERLRQAFIVHAGSQGSDVVAVIVAVIDTMVDVHAADADLHQVVFGQAPRPAELAAELAAIEQELVTVVSSFLGDAGATDAEHFADVARIAVATVESLVHRMVATRQPPMDTARFRDELVAMVTGYVTGAIRSDEATAPSP